MAWRVQQFPDLGSLGGLIRNPVLTDDHLLLCSIAENSFACPSATPRSHFPSIAVSSPSSRYAAACCPEVALEKRIVQKHERILLARRPRR